jgi:type II secretory pathway component PulM
MNEYLARVRAYWSARSIREQAFLAAGGIVVALALGYALLVDPMLKANRKLSAGLPQQRAELRLMRAQVSEIERLRASSRAGAKSGSALVHAVETAAAAHGVRAAVSNMTPLPGDRLRVATGPMGIVGWLAWFADLERQGIAIVAYRAATDAKSGLISIDAVLGGGA